MARRVSEEFATEDSLYENQSTENENAKKLLEYLIEEHKRALQAYGDYYDQLRVFRRAIKAMPATRVKTFPWPGASNLVVPLIRIAGDAVKARIVNTLLAPKPFWVAKSPNGSLSMYAKPVERFMEWAVDNDLDLVNSVEAIGDQVVYLGKCPIRICWEEVIRKIQTYDYRTKKKVSKIKTLRDAPLIKPILLEDWLEPWGHCEPKDKAWNTERVFYNLADLKEMERQGRIVNVSKLQDCLLQKLPQDVQDASEMRKLAWADSETVPLYLTCVLWDLDNDGMREELIVLWSYEYEVIFQLKFNFFWHGYRPLETAFYLRDSYDRSQGDGLCHLLEPLQQSLSTFVNQRTDNITIANTRTFKGKKGEIKKTGPNSQIYPGQIILMNDPEHDLKEMEMGTVTPQSFQHESMVRDYAERLSGISDPQLGREFDNPRVAATTTLSILQEGNRRFDLAIRLLREVFGTVGMRVFQLYQQFKPRVPLGEILSPEDEILVTELLNMPPDQVETSMILSLNTSTASSNKETQRQGLIALHQMIVGFYSQILDVAMKIMINPQIPDPIKDMIVDMAQASYNTIKEVVYTYDINDPETFLVDVATALNTIRAGGDPGGVESQIRAGLNEFGRVANSQGGVVNGANPSPIPAPTGIENEQQLAQSVGGGSSRMPNPGGGVALA